MRDLTAKGVRWDTSDLYSSVNDRKIEKDKNEVTKRTEAFGKKYKGKINTPSITSATLYETITEYESILEHVVRIQSFASYLHSIDTKDQAIGKFYQMAQELEATVAAALMWFEIELLAIPENTYRLLIDDKKLQQYDAYLKNVRKYKPFTLSEKEEVILTKKEQTSSKALIRLFDEVDASNTYILTIGKKKQVLNYSGLIPYLTVHPDRNVRKNASAALTEGLRNKEKLYAFTMNNLLNDKKITDEIRGYMYPQERSFLHYGVKKDTVGTMVESIEKGYRISERFYQLKRKAMRVGKLYEWDRYSYLQSGKTQTYSFDEAKNTVLSSYRQFSPVFADIAEKFFINKWIDAEILPNKRAGAYCSYNLPSLHPYVLVNYAGQIRDVTTLAHELGHGVHGYLSGQNNTLLQAWPSTVIAEVASIFAEMFVFDAIYQTVPDKDVKVNLLTEQLQSIFASVFRQNAFYLFESDIHMHRREKGELSIEEFNDYFQARLQAMFGNGLTLTPGHANWWMTVLHFYKYNFYVFSYSFGQMLSLALYANYKKSGQDAVKNYIAALSLGGSKDPYEITKTMGVDIADPNFWQNGLSYIDSLVAEFASLIDSNP